MADRDRQQLAVAYWNWVLTRNPADHPTQDRTGTLCAQGRGDRFWFLAGGAAEDRIERRCTVPFGTQIIVPVMAFVLHFAEMDDCRNNAKVASLAPFTFGTLGWRSCPFSLVRPNRAATPHLSS
ncbi:hypothetical protein HK414_01600 [Ramlibacter terrae]|uniref:Uncharacterized protein n=1 Tax=Ramlibacter terrae TaxID=2732511 RepID=A0ABX6NZA2_9BURK|nr:hypothetical protein HK414_01600 [Ramlibacter terrae]